MGRGKGNQNRVAAAKSKKDNWQPIKSIHPQTDIWEETTTIDDFNPPARTLVVLAAVPGSGKSTIANKWAEKGWTVVNLDTLRGQAPGSTGEADQSKTGWAVKQAQKLIDDALARGERVVSDATNVQTFVRRGLLEQAARAQARAYLVCLDYPKEISLKRNNSRYRVVPEDVIDRMYQQLQSAKQNAVKEGWNKLIKLKYVE